jgi:rubrerythrin
MTDHNPLGDGALAEVVSDPASRKKFLKMMGGTGGAAALSIAIAACGSSSSSGGSGSKPKSPPSGGGGGGGGGSSDKGDLAIVNYALTLEYLEADFYEKVVKSGLFKGAQADTIKLFGEQEQQHVQALEMTAKSLGKAAAKPKGKFPLKDAKSVLALAATVENLGASAYLGQAGAIKDKKILAAALSIHTVEARHAAALNTLLGKPITPDGAFAKPADMKTVLAAVKPFIVA